MGVLACPATVSAGHGREQHRSVAEHWGCALSGHGKQTHPGLGDRQHGSLLPAGRSLIGHRRAGTGDRFPGHRPPSARPVSAGQSASVPARPASPRVPSVCPDLRSGRGRPAVPVVPGASGALRAVGCRGRRFPLNGGAHTDQISFELSNDAQHVEQQPADRIFRVVDATADIQGPAFGRQLGCENSGVWQGPGQPAQLGHHQCVSGSDSSHRMSQPWARPIGPGQTMVYIYIRFCNTQSDQTLLLSGEVLLSRRDTCVTDQHANNCPG